NAITGALCAIVGLGHAGSEYMKVAFNTGRTYFKGIGIGNTDITGLGHGIGRGGVYIDRATKVVAVV
ncbi:MAG: hypothetical protein HF962_06655, partial [Sulfurovum sp.]|nr:hypothetical protein [Sulfurovum sp.]